MTTGILAAEGAVFHDVAGIVHATGAACSLTLGLIEASYKGGRIGKFINHWFPKLASPATGRAVAAAALLGGGVVLGATALRSAPNNDVQAQVPVVEPSAAGRVLVVPPFLNMTDRRAPIDVDVATGDAIGASTRSVRVERYGRDAQDRTMDLLAEIKPEGVTLIDRSRFDRFLDEFKFSESGMVSQESAIRVGRQLGARFVLLGEIKRLSITERHGTAPDGLSLTTYVAETEIGFKVQDVETGEVVGSTKASGKLTKMSHLPDADMISGAFDDAFQRLRKDAKLAGALKKLEATVD